MRPGVVLVLVGLSGCRLVSLDGLTFHCDASGACPTGLSCCADGFCRANCVIAANCDTRPACDGNPGAPCMAGRLRCGDGGVACVDDLPVRDGTLCGTQQVCQKGACRPCVNGASCQTNPTSCRIGALQCQPTPSCFDTLAQRPAGEACGADLVCSPAGVCTPCVAGAACTGNPTLCKTGVLSCSSGEPTCLDGAQAQAGAACGASQVCDTTGACVACVQDQPCPGNPSPCRRGALDCLASPPTCADSAGNRDAGTACGMNQVCSAAGACVDCIAGQSCRTNPTPCRLGISSCTSGAFECVDTSTQAPPGSSCGTNRVCSLAGTCEPCTEGAACTGNDPSTCKRGVTQCSSGVVACADGTESVDSGTPCGGGQTCTNGFCGTCVHNRPCTGNPTRCRIGLADCSGPTPQCADAAGNRDAGTPCGPNQVCDSVGACVPCAAAQPCEGNPNPCKVGVSSCASGAQTCVDSAANVPLGTLCPGGFCSAGGCVPCPIGAGCTSNPGAPCLSGSWARSGAVCACTDGSAVPGSPTCRDTTYTGYGDCSYPSDCANSGRRTRTRTTWNCLGGACRGADFTETDTAGCARTQHQRPCGNGHQCPAWPACNFLQRCDTSAPISRQCVDHRCEGESCEPHNVVENDTCTRSTNGLDCPAVSVQGVG